MASALTPSSLDMKLFQTLDDIRSSTSFLLPERDLVEFVALEPDKIRQTSLAKIASYSARITTIQRHICELNSIHNAALPLHVELPPELVFQVFTHLPFTYRRDIRVMHVCRLWRSILQRTPEFWASFLSHSLEQDTRRRYQGRYTLNEPMFLTALNRSSPLSVGLTGETRYLEILRTVPHHVVRLSSLTVTVASTSVDTLLSILRIKTPLLEKLVVKLTCWGHRGLMRTEIMDKIGSWVPPADHFPRLHTLDVNGVLFPTLAVSTLKHLRLSRCLRELCTWHESCSRTTIPTMDALVAGLQRCPSLLACTLDTCLPSRITANERTAVRLPQLREFVIRADTPSTRAILETITFPPSTVLTTSHCLTSQDSFLPTVAVRDLDTVSLRVRHLWKPSEQETRCNVTYRGFSDGQLRLWMGPDSTTLWATAATGVGRSEVLRTLVLVFSPLERLTLLELDIGVRVRVVEEDWKLILDLFVRLTYLSVRIDSCRTLLRVLRRGQTARALESLSIYCLKGRRVHELLVRTIEQRTARNLCLRRLKLRQMVYDYRRRERVEKEDDWNVPMTPLQLGRIKAVVAEVTTFPEVRGAD